MLASVYDVHKTPTICLSLTLVMSMRVLMFSVVDWGMTTLEQAGSVTAATNARLSSEPPAFSVQLSSLGETAFAWVKPRVVKTNRQEIRNILSTVTTV